MDRSPFVFRTIVVTLAFIQVSVVGVMLWGLFDSRVDNDKIFAIIGPAFHNVTGCFVGLLAGQMLGKKQP